MIVKASPENILRAGEILQRGGLVAFPTETVYGLGANAFDEAAIRAIYEAKGRPPTNPLIVHIASQDNLDQVIASDALSELQHTWIKKLSTFWPGPLSLVLPKNKNIPDIVSAGKSSIAVRIPRHRITRALIEAAGTPLAAPSANRSNYVSPTRPQHVSDCLGERVELILDGGICRVGIESTVLSLLEDVPRILRHGSITKEQLETVLETTLTEDTGQNDSDDRSQLSPGQLQSHYRPETPLCLSDKIEVEHLPQRFAAVLFSKNENPREDYIKKASHVSYLSTHGDLTAASQNLYSTLRALDQEQLDMIIIESCEEKEIGRALMDRIGRAIHCK